MDFYFKEKRANASAAAGRYSPTATEMRGL